MEPGQLERDGSASSQTYGYYQGSPSQSGSKAKSFYRSQLGSMSRRLPRVLLLPLLSFIFTALMFIIVGPIFSVYLKDNNANTKATWRWCALGPGIANCNPQGDAPYVVPDGGAVLIRGRINSLDLTQTTAAYVSLISFLGPLNDGQDFLAGSPDETLVIFGNQQNVTFSTGQRSGRFSLEIPMEVKTGTFNYPFDRYGAPLRFQAFINEPGKPNRYVPLIVEFSSNLPSIDLKIVGGRDTGVYASPTTRSSAAVTDAAIDIRRSNTTRFFSIFLVMAMWALSAATFVYVLDLVYLKPRPVNTDDAAYVAALLFALPTIRNVQPGVPDMGASVDVIGFFWNMALTAIAGLLVLGGLTAQTVQKQARSESDRSSFSSKMAKKLRSKWPSVSRVTREPSTQSQS